MNNILGKFLKCQRKIHKLKLNQASEELGISIQHLCNVERGAAIIPHKYCKKVAKLYNVELPLIKRLYVSDLISKYGWSLSDIVE